MDQETQFSEKEPNTKDTAGGELQLLRQELRRTRLFCLLSSALTVCLLVAVVILAGRLRPLLVFAEETGPKLDELLVFTEEIQPRLNEISGFIEESGPALDQLASVDMDALNATLKGIEGLDTEALSASLRSLNAIADTLNGVSNRISSLFSVFGGN